MKTCFLIAVFAAATYAQLLPPGVSQPPSSSVLPAPAADIGPDTVVATVAGIGVTVGDVRKLLETTPQAATQFQKDPRMVIQQVYEMKYLASEGEKLHLLEKSPLKEEYEAQLELLRQILLENAMVEHEHDGYQVTGDMIDEFYKKNQSRWEEAKIKIILIGFKPAPLPGAAKTTEDAIAEAAKGVLSSAHPLNERSEQEAQKLAADLVKQLRSGADFAKLVTQYSDDAESKASGGDFGTSIKATSSFSQDLKNVVFGLKPGEISGPVRQGSGYYVIRLEEKSVQPVDQVLSSIVKEIRDNHMNDFMSETNKRFTPQVVRPEFFVQPQKYIQAPAK